MDTSGGFKRRHMVMAHLYLTYCLLFSRLLASDCSNVTSYLVGCTAVEDYSVPQSFLVLLVPNKIYAIILCDADGYLLCHVPQCDALTAGERPLNKANEDKVLRLLSGCLLVALSNFRSSLPDDLALLGHQQQQQEVDSEASSSSAAAAESLDEDMRLAIGFRVELKKVLIKALQTLTSRVKEVAAMKELKEAAVVPLAKGQKPRAATSKGFGAGGSSSNGKSRQR